MEDVAADLFSDTMEVTLTTPTASTATTIAGDKAKPKPKAKVKKEMTAAKKEVQNQKRQTIESPSGQGRPRRSSLLPWRRRTSNGYSL
jgi:hypothetical protein